MKIRKTFEMISKRQALLLLGDFVIIAWFTHLFHEHASWGECISGGSVKFLPYLFAYYIFDLYNPRRDYRQSRELVRVAAVVFIGFLLSSFIFSFISTFSRRFMLLLFLNALICMPAWRLICSYICTVKPLLKKCLIVGTGQTGLETLHEIQQNRYSQIQVEGFIDASGKHETIEGLPVFGDYARIKETVKEKNIKIVVVSSLRDGGSDAEELMQTIIELGETGVEITTGRDVFSLLTNRIPLSQIDVFWAYLLTLNKSVYYRSPMKRVLDILTASAGIILSIPFYIVVPPLIKLTSKGPVFFRQERLGQNKRVFKIFKFRTMAHNSEDKGLFSTMENDSRITNLGKFLRLTKIDELPQFLNVLRGDMSVVGLRPVSVTEAAERMYEKNVPFWGMRFHMKPGVSGWAQVHYPYGSSIGEARRRMEYELFYIMHNSLILDLYVILKTVKCIFYIRGR